MMSQCRDYDDDVARSEGEPRLQQLLNDALAMVDSMSLPAEIGARLQEVVELTESHFSANDVRFSGMLD
jgi:hypothetical protein